jgi:hexokinase
MRNLCGKLFFFKKKKRKRKKKQYPPILWNPSSDWHGFLDYIAECVDTFLTEQGLEDQETELNLGYTFSFPVLQTKVKSWSINGISEREW